MAATPGAMHGRPGMMAQAEAELFDAESPTLAAFG